MICANIFTRIVCSHFSLLFFFVLITDINSRRSWQSRFYYCINGDEIPVRIAEVAVLTFRCRPGPSTCQEWLWLMSLIFRTQSARVALMSRGRVWCPRGLYAVSTPCGGHLGLPRDEGKRRGLARGSPGYELMRTAWITERVVRTNVVRTSFSDGRCPRHAAYKKKRGRSRFSSRIYLAFSLQDRTRLISLTVKWSERRLSARDLVVLKFARMPGPFFAILKQPM